VIELARNLRCLGLRHGQTGVDTDICRDCDPDGDDLGRHDDHNGVDGGGDHGDFGND